MVTTSTDRLYGESSGVAVKAPVVAVSQGANLPLSGLPVLGGYSVQPGDRVLVKDQSNPIQNGIYNASSSAWQRTGDFAGSYDCVQGTLVVAYLGVGQQLLYQLVTFNPVIGTSPLNFVLFQGPNTLPWPKTQGEVNAGVTIVNGSYIPGDVRRYGAVGDANINGTAGPSGVDSTAAILAAVSIVGQATYIPSGNWLVRNLILPGGTVIIGDGIHATNLVVKQGTTGIVVTDNGSAAKTDVSGVAWYCNNLVGLTAGARFGKSPSIAYGTEAYWDRVWIRDLPAGALGFDFVCNVGEFGFIIDQTTAGMRILGTATMIRELESQGASGFAAASGQQVAVELGDVGVGTVHIEAPANGVAAIAFTGQVNATAVTIAPAGSGAYTNADHLIDIGAACTTWEIGQLLLYFKDNTAVLTNQVFYYQGPGIYQGGNIQVGGVASHAAEGRYNSGQMCSGGQLGFKLQQLNAFTIRLFAAAGPVTQHAIGSVGNVLGQVSNVATSVNAAQTALVNTPTGSDASTAFSHGAKISSAQTNLVILDTGRAGPMQPGDATFIAVVQANNTGTAYTVVPVIQSINVNGVTVPRLCLALLNATTGANVAWATALGTPGNLVDITVFGFLK